MARIITDLPRRLFLLTMLAGAALITATSLAYFDLETLPPFVIEKLPVRFEALWLASLRIHVAAALTSFPLCIALMTRALQRRVAWHRWIGRVAGVVMLGALLPSGVVLAFDAKGGRVVTAGFLLSAAIIGWFLPRGILAARRRDVIGHQRAMRHVTAQMSVAVTSRVMLFGFDSLGVDPSIAYVVALWGPVVVSAAAAELVSLRSRSRTRSSKSVVRPVERNPRELSSLHAALPRVRALFAPFARLGR